MSLQSPETMTRQVENAARGAADRAAASVRQETSIPAWANRLLAGGGEKCARKPRGEGVYILSAEEARRGQRPDRPHFVAPDGYVRRSPTQELKVDPAYGRRLALRAAACAVGAGAVVLILYALVRVGILGF